MVLFTACFALGVWLLQQQTSLPAFGWAWLLPGLPVALLFPDRPGALRAVRIMLFAAFALGLGFYHAAWRAEQRLAVELPGEWQGRDITVLGVVSDLPRRFEQGQHFSFDVEKVLTAGAVVPEHLYLSTYYSRQTEPPVLHAAERWRLTVRLKQPHGSSNPHGFDFELWALENNVRAVGYVSNKADNLRMATLSGGFNGHLQHWRELVRDKLAAALPAAPYAGVLTALAIGDQGSIPPDQWQVFTRTGVNHLMSISGLHITMLSGLGFALAYWLWRRSVRLTLMLPARKAAALAALLVALAYALLSGFAVPAQRTVYMAGAVAAALWLNRNFSPAQILCIALLGVLIPDPWAILSPGFWLSFGAVALILYVTAYRLNRSRVLREGDGAAVGHTSAYPSRVLVEYARVQWAMTIGLVPMLLALFQQVSLVSPVANAFAIPLVSLVVVPLTLLGAALPAYLGSVPLWLAHQVMALTMSLLEWLNSLPQVVWTQHAPASWSVAAGMLGALLILLPHGFPARWLGVVLMLPMFLNGPPQPAENSLRLTIFDVGQGLAVAAQTRHHALLYDAGPDYSGSADSGNRILIPALRAMGIGKLDGLILTHDDTDHTGGAVSIMQAMPIDWIDSSLPDQHPLLQTSIEERRCMDGQRWQWDGVSFEILHPGKASYADAKISDNNRGCVLRISIAGQHILLAADIEKASEAELLARHAGELPADLLVVPHHGSRTSSTPGFIAAVRPQYAVFTSGYRNRFGHPSPDIVQRYADSGAVLLRSDRDGAILVDLNAGGLKLERYRETHRHYWTHLALP